MFLQMHSPRNLLSMSLNLKERRLRLIVRKSEQSHRQQFASARPVTRRLGREQLAKRRRKQRLRLRHPKPNRRQPKLQSPRARPRSLQSRIQLPLNLQSRKLHQRKHRKRQQRKHPLPRIQNAGKQRPRRASLLSERKLQSSCASRNSTRSTKSN